MKQMKSDTLFGVPLCQQSEIPNFNLIFFYNMKTNDYI